MNASLLPLSAADYQKHAIHEGDRAWTETNCYVDVWVEVLHSLGLQPLAASVFSVSSDFEGDQWTFFKFPPADLQAAYGIDVHEMNPWRGTLTHTLEQLELGRLLTIEVDSFFLPDTHGVSYQREHVKSTIVPNLVDPEARRLGYWHNAGYFELADEDFDGVFRQGPHAVTAELPPYVELIRLESLTTLPDEELAAVASGLLVEHLGRRPTDNPVERMAQRLNRDMDWVRTQPPETFHLWAFATVRQCGACAALAGESLAWLGAVQDRPALQEAADAWRALAESAKAVQFLMARFSRGRAVSLDEPLKVMADQWAEAQKLAVAGLGT